MSEASSLLARRRAYRLLGGLLVEGIDSTRAAALARLPTLREYVDESMDLDELAAQHYSQLGHELLPFAGVYLGNDGLVGGGTAGAVLRSAHAVVGIDCPDDPSPDHLGQVLRLMAVLVDAQLDAISHGDDADARTLRHWQRRVLDEAVLPWMPPLAAALAGRSASLWTRAIEMAIGVLAQHRAEDPGLPSIVGNCGDEDSLELLLDQPGTGLTTIATMLTTPARCGVYLTRGDLAEVARRCELPRGFGTRRGMLEKILRGAAEYDAIPRLVAELDRLMAARGDTYAAMSEELGLAAHVTVWRRRLATTRQQLARLADAAEGRSRSSNVVRAAGG